PAVEVTTVRSMQPKLDVVLPGELKPWNKTEIYPKVKGYVNRVMSDRGMSVVKGQLLATLDAPELVASVKMAQAKVSTAEAALLERQSKQKASKRTYFRILKTSETKGAI